MNKELLINVTPSESRLAVMEEGVLQEIHLNRDSSSALVGNLYRGRIVRIVPGMQAAFVDIGLSKHGFLHVSDALAQKWDPQQAKTTAAPPIQSMLREGEELLLQVTRDAVGDKGVGLSADLSLSTAHLVYQPYGSRLSISRQIEDGNRREQLTELLRQETANFGGGYIVRTQSTNATAELIKQQLHQLYSLWNKIKLDGDGKTGLVFERPPLYLRYLENNAARAFRKIRVDDRTAHAALADYAREMAPDLLETIELFEESGNLFDVYGVENEIERALDARVELPSGGEIVIEHTEAMTTIDVNTASFVGHKEASKTHFLTNCEAAEAIAEQLRLRNLGGIVVIDFIDLGEQQQRDTLLKLFQQAIAADRAPIRVGTLSEFGLLELSRKRSSDSLHANLYEGCSVCEGSGRVKTAESIGIEIMREIRREDAKFKASSYTVIAAPAVVSYLTGTQELSHLQELINRPIEVTAQSQFQQPQYDIALGRRKS